jgi:hypothetical protein
MTTQRRHLTLARCLALFAVACAALASTATAGSTTKLPGVQLQPVKSYLLQHTAQITRFTGQFDADAAAYDRLAKASGYNYARLWREQQKPVSALVNRLKRKWVDGNPLYERVEGIVAGTPSLSLYDVIIDAGSSAKEDPASAVPFSLRLADGRTLKQPGNFYNLTEGMLWGTRPEFTKRKVDLNGDGRAEFGEILPDAIALRAATQGFDSYARQLDRSARAWTPTASDAFTSLVVMIPTMTEYFGQWKVSRFVLGSRANGEAFNVVSRLSDIGDILGGLRVIYAGVGPAIAKQDPQQSAQTRRELDSLWSFVGKLKAQEGSGKRFVPQQADTLGRTAQDRGTAIAGQITQAAARLKVKIVQ